MRIRIVAATGCVVVLSLSTFVAEGRAVMRGGRRRGPVNSVEAASVDGTIERVEAGRILVTTAPPSSGKNGRNNNQQPQRQAPPGQHWLLVIYPGTKIMVNGRANPDYLRTGLYVDFKAQYDGKTVQDKVSELTVVSYSPDRPPGLYPGGAGVESILSPAGAAPGPVKHVKKKDTQGGNLDAGTGMYEIIGRITSCKDNKLTVLANKGEKALTVELVVACCDAPPVLELGEQVFDFVARPIERLVIGERNLSAFCRWNAGLGSAFFQCRAEPVAVIAAVGNQGFRLLVGRRALAARPCDRSSGLRSAA